ncbi:MAG: hypothetical protein ACRDFS_00930, partial [Chloroflexota bacterium]
MRRLPMAVALLVLAAWPAGSVLAAAGHAHSYQFSSSGSGAETSASAADCQNAPLLACTVDTNGIQSTSAGPYTFTGPYSSTLTIDYSSATSNGDGGYCAPATGTSV